MNWIDRELITAPFFIGLCLDEKQFHKQLKKMKMPITRYPEFITTNHADATTHIISSKNDTEDVIIVCMKKNKKRSLTDTFGLLLHEAVHIFQKIKRHIGEDSPSDEFEAYSIQIIALRLMWAYEKMK